MKWNIVTQQASNKISITNLMVYFSHLLFCQYYPAACVKCMASAKNQKNCKPNPVWTTKPCGQCSDPMISYPSGNLSLSPELPSLLSHCPNKCRNGTWLKDTNESFTKSHKHCSVNLNRIDFDYTFFKRLLKQLCYCAILKNVIKVSSIATSLTSSNVAFNEPSCFNQH